MIGVVGTHFSKGAWSTIVLPFVMVIFRGSEGMTLLEKTWNSIVHHMRTKYGMDLDDCIEEIFWDGRPEVVSFLLKRFSHLTGHIKVCLQHARKRTSERFTGGYKPSVPDLMDWTAFLPPVLFHLFYDKLFENLRAQGAQECGLSYLNGGDGIGSLHLDGGPYRGQWQSHYL